MRKQKERQVDVWLCARIKHSATDVYNGIQLVPPRAELLLRLVIFMSSYNKIALQSTSLKTD